MKKLLAFLLIAATVVASVNVTVNGTTYTIPQTSERGWGTAVTSWIQGISGATLQKSGGSFTLTADVDFGSTYGLKAGYFISKTANAPSVGTLRLANADTIVFRNSLNTGNFTISAVMADYLTAAGSSIKGISDTATFTNKTLNAIGNGSAYGTLYLDASKNLATVNGTTGQVLKSNGASAAPSYGSAGASLAYVAKTHADTGYTILNTDDFILWTLTNASNDTATLPACSGNAGKVFRIKLAATTAAFNTLTVGRAGADTITLADGTTGATSLVFFTAGEEYEFVSDGTSVWQVLNHRTNVDLSFVPTVAGVTTLTNGVYYASRSGSMLNVTGSVQITTLAATSCAIVFPTGLAIDTTKLTSQTSVQHVGDIYRVANSSIALPTVSYGVFPLFYDGSTSGSVFLSKDIGTGSTYTFTKVNTNSAFSSDDRISFRFSVPISGWKP